MDTVHLPAFILSREGDLITSRIMEFQKLCCMLAEGRSGEKDPSVKIFTKLMKYPPIRGLSVLNNLLDLVKDSVFAFKTDKAEMKDNLQDEVISRLSAAGDPVADHAPPHNVKRDFSKFLDRKAFSVCNKLFLELNGICHNHMYAVSNLNAAIKVYQELDRKRMEAFNSMNASVKEFYECTFVSEEKMKIGQSGLDAHQKCVRYKEQFRLYQLKSEQAYEGLEPLFEAERKLREEKLTKIDGELRSLLVSEIKDRITDGIKSLLEVATSCSFPGKLLHELENLDSSKTANKLYNDACMKYFHPVIQKSHEQATTVHSTCEGRHFNVMEKDERKFRAFGSTLCLLDRDSNGKRREELYVWANNTLDDGSKTAQLKLKIGTKIKQKLCSADGKLAFGWTRKFSCGAKKYGFYPTSATQLVP